MTARRCCLSLLAMAACGSGLRAELLPYWPVHWMCGEADGIVVGERTGANLVRVEEWLLPPSGGEPAPAELEIVALGDHSRMIGKGRLLRKADGTVVHRPLKSRRLVCFLERKGVAWYSMSPAGSGSSGMVWIEADRCYRYQQMINPGPYILAPDPNCPTEEVLRTEIARALADRRDWEAALEIVHPEEKAVVLASYLLPRTSPEEDRGTYLRRVRQVLPKLGKDAVLEVMELMRGAQPGDDLAEAVLVLCDLGREARPAVPQLLELLRRPEQVHPVRVLEALGRIGDATVAPHTLPLLEHEELHVRAEAAKALAAFRYQDAAAEIAESLPAEVGDGEAYDVYAALVALKALDARRAAALAERYVDQPAMKHVRNLLDPILVGAEEGKPRPD